MPEEVRDFQIKVTTLLISFFVAWTTAAVYFTATTVQLNDKLIFTQGQLAATMTDVHDMRQELSKTEEAVALLNHASISDKTKTRYDLTASKQ